MHPFLRLAKSYQQLFKTDSNKYKDALDTKTKITQYIQKMNNKPEQEVPSFKVCFMKL